MASADFQKPPQALILFPSEPSVLISRAEKAIVNSRKVQDSIVSSVKEKDATFENVLLPIIYDENIRLQEERVLKFFSSTSPMQGLRQASVQASRMLDDSTVESYMREDVFRLIDAVFRSGERLDTESQHYLERKHRKYIEHGLGIPEGPQRSRFEILRKEIANLTRDCQKNFSGEVGGIWLTREELKGVPEDVLSRFKVGDGENEGKLWHTFKKQELDATAQYAENAETRKAVCIAAENRCNINIKPMKSLFVLRDELARLLGYPSYAAFQLEYNVAKSPQNVHIFLNDLRQLLTPMAEAEIEALLDLKRKDLSSQGLKITEEENKLYLWDFPYYRARLDEQTLALDQNKVAEYFPLQSTLERLFHTFEQLLGVRVVPVSMQDLLTTPDGESAVWHEDISILSIWDNDDTAGAFLGYIYLDLHPREFKRGQSGHWRLHPGYTAEDGTRHYPSSAIVFNCAKPTAEKPSLLKHKEMISLFHEMGHGFRNVVTKTKFASCHGGYDTDFIETPSKMLDHWFWEPSQIKKMGYHYSNLSSEYKNTWNMCAQIGEGQKNISQPLEIPDSLIASIVSSRGQSRSVDRLNQVFLASFALAVHQPISHEAADAMDPTEMYNRMREEFTMLAGPEGHHWGNNQGKFTHVFGHWAAAYYSYLHSSSVAADMFYTAFNKDPSDFKTGSCYRYTVLEPGGSRPQFLNIEQFLGRPPNNAAYLKELLGQ